MIDFEKVRLRRFDSLNWCIERQQDKGKWVVIGYFPRLEQAAIDLLTLSDRRFFSIYLANHQHANLFGIAGCLVKYGQSTAMVSGEVRA